MQINFGVWKLPHNILSELKGEGKQILGKKKKKKVNQHDIVDLNHFKYGSSPVKEI